METTKESKQTKPKAEKKAPKKGLQEEAAVQQPVVQEMKVEVAPVKVTVATAEVEQSEATDVVETTDSTEATPAKRSRKKVVEPAAE